MHTRLPSHLSLTASRGFLAALLLPLIGGCGGAGNHLGETTPTPTVEMPATSPFGETSIIGPTNAAPENADEAATAPLFILASDSWPSGNPRYVQSILFGSMDGRLAASIGDRMLKVGGANVAGLAFSPARAYASNGAWTNAMTVVNKFGSANRTLLVKVHLGHHATEDQSAKGWAKSFYDGIFAAKWRSAYWVISPGNEYTLSNASFDRTMTEFTNELLARWKAGAATKNLTFPSARIRLCQYGLKGTRRMNGYTVEGEYHLPAQREASTGLPRGYSVAGNDGQTISPMRAYNSATGGDLAMIDATKYMGYCSGIGALLWLPPLHRWAYDTRTGKYITSKREDPTGNQRNEMLDLIERFVKS